MSQTAEPGTVRLHRILAAPPERVYRAFVDPAVTTRFWFSRASGPLQPGATVLWYWDQYDVSAEVRVMALEPSRRIAIEWPTPVQWLFTPRGREATFVTITAYGFDGSEEEQVAAALDATAGFNLVVAACKAWLEHGIDIGVVGDAHPTIAGDT